MGDLLTGKNVTIGLSTVVFAMGIVAAVIVQKNMTDSSATSKSDKKYVEFMLYGISVIAAGSVIYQLASGSSS